jgi:ligand-binding SRPBCC domain-containing protein
VYAFHSDVSNFPRISPPFAPVEVVAAPNPTQTGDPQHFVLRLGLVRVAWTARITRMVPDRLIEDVQERGPFRAWRHQHRITPTGNGSRLTDVIVFRLFPGWPGELAEYWSVRPALLVMLWWRHRRTRQLIAAD